MVLELGAMDLNFCTMCWSINQHVEESTLTQVLYCPHPHIKIHTQVATSHHYLIRKTIQIMLTASITSHSPLAK